MWDLILVAFCLASFFAVNLSNVLRFHMAPSKPEEPEVPWPSGFVVGIAALGTVVFFLDSLFYMLLGIFDSLFLKLTLLDAAPLSNLALKVAGALTMAAGYAIFIWSVLVRGRYATSWNMSPKHRLVDWGPYRYVRHPSYLGYFLMFIGFFFMWPNLITLIPLLGIPGYILVTNQEEEMLVKRFGESYLRYRRRVGRFFPKVRFWKQFSNIRIAPSTLIKEGCGHN
jgi:protein-S-isoprenylcysteine O-methyltransferase Ste14